MKALTMFLPLSLVSIPALAKPPTTQSSQPCSKTTLKFTQV